MILVWFMDILGRDVHGIVGLTFLRGMFMVQLIRHSRAVGSWYNCLDSLEKDINGIVG